MNEFGISIYLGIGYEKNKEIIGIDDIKYLDYITDSLRFKFI